MRVLGLALYGSLAASTRYRLEQYVEGLAKYGIDLYVRHLLDDDYLSRRFSGGPLQPWSVVKCYLRRLQDLLLHGPYDMSVVYGEVMPLLPAPLERALLLRAPYVYDMDDAFYLKYRSGRLAVMQPFLGRKLDRVMRGAAHVTAGNKTLTSYASQHNPRTSCLPTVVDTGRYQPDRSARNGATLTVGWIGSPSTAPYLEQVADSLSQVGQEGPLRLVVIGGKAPTIPHVEVVELPWSEAAEVQLINSFDVGIMPLPDDDWARGKCAFKLIQYMACAVPVIASPVGANSDVVTSESGLLARTTEEWSQSLRVLRDDPAKRSRMGDAGRSRIEAHYSLQHNLPVLAQVLTQASGRS